MKKKNKILGCLTAVILVLLMINNITASALKLKDIPKYKEKAFITLNNNVPDFTDEEKKNTRSYEYYGDLDKLGRCTIAESCVGTDLMSSKKRESISNIKPTGWNNVTYDNISGKYLYNRCHLIAYQLTAENENKKNLITGTRYLNIEGMLPFENKVTSYIKETGNHVMYRVVPIFEGNELVARGVTMEAYSIEDDGKGISFNVYCYNVQPGIEIDYSTGESTLKNNDPDNDSTGMYAVYIVLILISIIMGLFGKIKNIGNKNQRF